ncbi:MAG: hypothetical protein NC116_04390 [Clostridium sp.]|nr:hypothetical protein [Clostridium sp.]
MELLILEPCKGFISMEQEYRLKNRNIHIQGGLTVLSPWVAGISSSGIEKQSFIHETRTANLHLCFPNALRQKERLIKYGQTKRSNKSATANGTQTQQYRISL